MYMNQLIISFILFACLVYVTTLPKKENFYSTQNFTNPNYTSNMQYDRAALYYHPNHPYYQPKHGPLPQNNCNNPDNTNNVQQQMYMEPKNDNTITKCMFCLLLVGMLYTGYTYGYFNMVNNTASVTSTTNSSR